MRSTETTINGTVHRTVDDSRWGRSGSTDPTGPTGPTSPTGETSTERRTGRSRPRAGVRGTAAAAVIALSVLGGLGVVATTPAGASAACRISDFRNEDGTLDTVSYLACVAPQQGDPGPPPSETLPVTGSDASQLLGLAGVLVVLGVGASIGSRRLRGERGANEPGREAIAPR